MPQTAQAALAVLSPDGVLLGSLLGRCSARTVHARGRARASRCLGRSGARHKREPPARECRRAAQGRTHARGVIAPATSQRAVVSASIFTAQLRISCAQTLADMAADARIHPRVMRALEAYPSRPFRFGCLWPRTAVLRRAPPSCMQRPFFRVRNAICLLWLGLHSEGQRKLHRLSRSFIYA
eukprot:2792182-Pleurochrysis_carterae.AAC.1